jgi:6-pyruvoyltetrahydropterin/6-carboxytetrahydropterin synthase
MKERSAMSSSIGPVYVTRRAVFSSAHRLHSPHLSDAENASLYGKCNNRHGHGHNYELEVTLKLPMDPRTGMGINLVDLKRIMDERVCSELDHKHLEQDTLHFRDLPSTAENVSVVCWRLLEPHVPAHSLYEVRVRETENNVAFYRGPNG